MKCLKIILTLKVQRNYEKVSGKRQQKTTILNKCRGKGNTKPLASTSKIGENEKIKLHLINEGENTRNS